ncbi:MAG: hypothetical protein ACOY4F_10495 [Thermodesulfobacteriota bacterium]
MKKLSLLLAVLALFTFCSPFSAQAQNGPGIKESINTFMTYFNETVVQSIRIQEILKDETLSDADSLFFFDLVTRLEKTLGLVLNLRDLYFLYGKTTYCFTKDERKYILDRIENISGAFKQIVENKYIVSRQEIEGHKNDRLTENLGLFNDRVNRLRAFLEISQEIFR